MLHLVPAWLRRGTALAALLTAPFLATAQNVGIGTTAPTQTLDVNGNLRVRGATGAGTRLLQADATGTVSPAATALPAGAAVTPGLAATATGLNNPLVAASGPLVVVLNKGAGSLSLYDVSNPAGPVLRGTATGLTSPVSVAVSGTTAAVISSSAPYTISLFTLGSGAPVLAATTNPAGATNVLGGVALVGTTLYAVTDKSASRGLLYVYDVSNPASPVQRNASTGTPTGTYTPLSVAAAGTLVCVTSPYALPAGSVQLSVMDVSNPASPTVAAVVNGNGTDNYSNSPRPLAMSPGLVAVLRPESNQLFAYDLGTPTAPVLRATYTTAANPVSVALSGALAYVACAGTNTLQVVDLSTGTATLRGSVALDATAQSVAATSALVLAANRDPTSDLQVFTLPTRTLVVYPDGTAASAASPGAADFIQNQTAAVQTGGFRVSGAGSVGTALNVGTTATIGGAAIIGGAASVGGNASVGGTATLGSAGAPGQVLTPATGSHNMLAVAYGQLNGVGTTTGQVISGSDNFTISNVGVSGSGAYYFTIKFTAASGLATTDLSAYLVLATRVDMPGFVQAAGSTNGQVGFAIFNGSGAAAPGKFNFVLYQP